VTQQLPTGVEFRKRSNDHCHGDTIQALYRHQYASPFERIGQQDLSHAVDFGALKRLIDQNLSVNLTSQAEFLLRLGLEQRLDYLCKKASSEQIMQLRNAAIRLIAPNEMGTLFNVLTIESCANYFNCGLNSLSC
jgi:NADH dehydrogenase [ubiquinone] 1 alpha subcomplex assembly factor 7